MNILRQESMHVNIVSVDARRGDLEKSAKVQSEGSPCGGYSLRPPLKPSTKLIMHGSVFLSVFSNTTCIQTPRNISTYKLAV